MTRVPKRRSLPSDQRASMNFREGASYEEPKLLELVKSLRVDMDNSCRASSRRIPIARRAEVISIQAGG